MTFMTGLQCHLCGTKFPAEALWVCDQCLGPLEVEYDYDAIREALTREIIERRPRNVWRFRELLPITGEPRTGFHSGYTPLIRADRLARRLGLQELYIKAYDYGCKGITYFRDGCREGVLSHIEEQPKAEQKAEQREAPAGTLRFAGRRLDRAHFFSGFFGPSTGGSDLTYSAIALRSWGES